MKWQLFRLVTQKKCPPYLKDKPDPTSVGQQMTMTFGVNCNNWSKTFQVAIRFTNFTISSVVLQDLGCTTRNFFDMNACWSCITRKFCQKRKQIMRCIVGKWKDIIFIFTHMFGWTTEPTEPTATMGIHHSSKLSKTRSQHHFVQHPWSCMVTQTDVGRTIAQILYPMIFPPRVAHRKRKASISTSWPIQPRNSCILTIKKTKKREFTKHVPFKSRAHTFQ